MAEVAPAPVAAPAKAPKKRTAKPKKAGPSVGELVVKAVSASKDRKGVSLPALKKALAAGGYDVEKNNARVKVAIKGLVNKGTLVHTKGIGASGSFKLSKKPVEAKKRPAAKKAKKTAAKKPAAAKKPKKTAAKKPTSTKKTVKKVKKAAAPKKATKSPKKAKKPASKAPKKAKAAKPKAPKAKAAKPKKAAAKKK